MLNGFAYNKSRTGWMIMVDNICENRLCTGCAACRQICPCNAIEMKPNEEGFLYPVINEELCSDCGMCRSTCLINKYASDGAGSGVFSSMANSNGRNNTSRNDSNKEGRSSINTHRAYACYAKDENIRLKSTSGGAFSVLAQYIIQKKGVVFGAAFDEDFKVCHRYTENENGLELLRRSKYVQSDTDKAFSEAEAFLREGRMVMYCGTPCQIAGLNAYLDNEYEELITCDLACSGVPSPKVWEMYLDFLQERHKSKIKAVSFRNKTTGWSNSSMKVDFENDSYYLDEVRKEIFFIGFGKSIYNRSSCYNCLFRLNNTKADITLADFWGIERLGDSDFLDNKGVSLVIVNTAKGNEAVTQIKDRLFVKEKPLDDAVRYNPRLVSSVPVPDGRTRFFSDMKAGYSFDKLRRKYMDNFSIKYRVKCLAKKILGKA